jgi:hypothetical protein
MDFELKFEIQIHKIIKNIVENIFVILGKGNIFISFYKQVNNIMIGKLNHNKL